MNFVNFLLEIPGLQYLSPLNYNEAEILVTKPLKVQHS